MKYLDAILSVDDAVDWILITQMHLGRRRQPLRLFTRSLHLLVRLNL